VPRPEIYEKVYKSISVEAEAVLLLRLAALAKQAERPFGEYIRLALLEHADREEAKSESKG
jgi:hypothetical protein